MKDSPFVGVLITAKSRRMHLLVNMETRKTACGNVMKAGTRYGLDLWNGYAPAHCPPCDKEWEKRQQ
jgi:hypothetical protein